MMFSIQLPSPRLLLRHRPRRRTQHRSSISIEPAFHQHATIPSDPQRDNPAAAAAAAASQPVEPAPLSRRGRAVTGGVPETEGGCVDVVALRAASEGCSAEQAHASRCDALIHSPPPDTQHTMASHKPSTYVPSPPRLSLVLTPAQLSLRPPQALRHQA